MKSKVIIAKIIFAGALLVWLGRTGRLDLGVLLNFSSFGCHLIGLALVTVCLVVQILRWWILLRAQGLMLSFRRSVWLSWVGFFISLSIPGMAGGVLSRGYLVAKDVSATGRMGAVSTVILDKVMGLVALLCLGTAVLFGALIQNGWDRNLAPVWLFTAMFFVAVAVMVAMAWIGPIRQWILSRLPRAQRDPVKRMVTAYRRQGWILLIAFGISLLSAMVTMGAFMIAGRTVGDTVSWSQACQVVPLVFVAGTLPLAPDGIGVSETTAALLFSQYGIASGASIMLIYRLWLLVLRLPGGLLFLFHKPNAVS